MGWLEKLALAIGTLRRDVERLAEHEIEVQVGIRSGGSGESDLVVDSPENMAENTLWERARQMFVEGYASSLRPPYCVLVEGVDRTLNTILEVGTALVGKGNVGGLDDAAIKALRRHLIEHVEAVCLCPVRRRAADSVGEVEAYAHTGVVPSIQDEDAHRLTAERIEGD